jgi:DNA-directed RNA polymerase beta' subunit
MKKLTTDKARVLILEEYKRYLQEIVKNDIELDNTTVNIYYKRARKFRSLRGVLNCISDTFYDSEGIFRGYNYEDFVFNALVYTEVPINGC